MRLIAHISDLHIGTEVPDIMQALTRDLKKASPHILLVSGDLTQRARKYQFALATEFLNQFPIPKLVVPGNHDVPLFNLYGRLINPLAKYHFFFPSVAESDYQDDQLLILGLNSTRRWRIRRGQLSHSQLEYMRRFFCSRLDSRFRIFMSHHPLMPAPFHFPRDLVGRRKHAVKVLAACDVSLAIVGHSHRIYVQNLQHHYPFLERPMVMAQAGTAVSRRTFGRPQAYNLICVKKKEFTVETRVYGDGHFSRREFHTFARHE